MNGHTVLVYGKFRIKIEALFQRQKYFHYTTPFLKRKHVKYTQMFISVSLDFHIIHFKTDFKTTSRTIQMFLTKNTSLRLINPQCLPYTHTRKKISLENFIIIPQFVPPTQLNVRQNTAINIVNFSLEDK